MAQVVQKRGINRPSAAHLALPLVERHSLSYGASRALHIESFLSDAIRQENVLNIVSTASGLGTPLSSASMYSQASFIPSPALFSNERVNPRRFAIARTPLVDGPWTRIAERVVDGLRNVDVNANIFVLDLRSATTEPHPLTHDLEGHSPSDSEVKGFKSDIVERISDEFVLVDFEPVAVLAPDTVSQPKPLTTETTKPKLKRLRTTSGVIRKMISRLSLHPPPARAVEDEDRQLVPTLPPQILLSLPSPSLKILNSLKDERHVKIETLVARHLPSTWKPCRPPSPLPPRFGKHKRSGSSLSRLIGASPPPPLPTNTLALTGRKGPIDGPFLAFPTSLNEMNDDQDPEYRWPEIQARLKARAAKGGTYAVHNGGIISPTSA
ncbi:hypothetical protein H0H81_001650 [Sphagnurus paluster]|uniref:Uncharacterized protein n=1 Tax=Sphagnurus paluster TaxID=117069 RepID=A0A9P7GFZ8_9AGAR|nr:hypothetical protein H0H81_001650 [Sphagnurus paluster]